MDTVPIIQLRQPWAWATVAGHRRHHGVKTNVFTPGNSGRRRMREQKSDRGIAAIVSSGTLFEMSAGISWLRENGFNPPRHTDLPLGALLGFVDVVDSVRRADVAEDPLVDEHPWQLVIRTPVELLRPLHRRAWKVNEGLGVSDAIELLADCRNPMAKIFIRRLHSLEEVSGLAAVS